MDQQPNGVMIAVDWENIRRSARLYQSIVMPAKLCDVLRDVGGIFGEVLGGKAFGDWSLRPDDGREFAQHGITPYQAPRTAAGKDRSDPAILLEVYEWIRDRDDCSTVILASGDSDYQVLVDRARARPTHRALRLQRIGGAGPSFIGPFVPAGSPDGHPVGRARRREGGTA